MPRFGHKVRSLADLGIRRALGDQEVKRWSAANHEASESTLGMCVAERTDDPTGSWAGGTTAARAIDIAVAAVLLALCLPVLVVAAIGAALSLRANPFFVQQRVGQGGRGFWFVKIRTLPPEVPTYVDKHQLDRWAIPPFCRLLRRLHLDELPQLLLVLKGQMSLVGPRPEMAHLHHAMGSEFSAARTSRRPGCTGLWQISTSCTGLIAEAPQYDVLYVEQRTPWLDLWILYRTILKMLGVGRFITLDDIPAGLLRRPAALERADRRLPEAVAHDLVA